MGEIFTEYCSVGRERFLESEPTTIDEGRLVCNGVNRVIKGFVDGLQDEEKLAILAELLTEKRRVREYFSDELGPTTLIPHILDITITSAIVRELLTDPEIDNQDNTRAIQFDQL